MTHDEHEQTTEQNKDLDQDTAANTAGEGDAAPTPEEPIAPPEPESPDQQLANLKDQLLRKAAEFENYKRRMESEMRMIVRLANENLVLEVLPVVDDLERSLKAGAASDDLSSFRKGLEMIHQKMKKVLESHGVTPLETEGKPFDVHFHDAMMQMPKAGVEPNTVIEEVEKGYAMNGKVIRHAKVIVSAPGPGTTETDPKGDAE